MAISGWSSANYLSRASAPVTAVPLSMAIWFNTPLVPPAAAGTLMGISDSATHDERFTLFQGSGTGRVSALTMHGGAGVAATGAVVPTVNVWNHAAGVFASSTDRRSFLNGSDKGTNSTSSTPTGLNQFTIGNTAPAVVGDNYVGPLAHAAIWNVALTDAEVALLAKGLSPLLVRRDALVGYWPLVGTGGTEASVYKSLPLTLSGTLTKSAAPPFIMPRRKLLLGA